MRFCFKKWVQQNLVFPKQYRPLNVICPSWCSEKAINLFADSAGPNTYSKRLWQFHHKRFSFDILAAEKAYSIIGNAISRQNNIVPNAYRLHFREAWYIPSNVYLHRASNNISYAMFKYVFLYGIIQYVLQRMRIKRQSEIMYSGKC